MFDIVLVDPTSPANAFDIRLQAPTTTGDMFIMWINDDDDEI